VIVGVPDKVDTAVCVNYLFGVTPSSFGGFQITGVDHEAKHLNKSMDQLFQMVTDKIRGSELSEPLKSYVNSHMKCVSYFDKTIFVFEIEGEERPSLYKKKYFERQGTQVIEVDPENYAALFSRFR
jgi:predicted HTH transcriptional regulator